MTFAIDDFVCSLFCLLCGMFFHVFCIFLQLVCNIQSESQEMLSLCVDSGIIDDLISDLSGL